MEKLKLLIVISMFSTLLIAEGILVVTFDKDGNGIIKKVKNVTLSDLKIIYDFGGKIPEDTTAIILEKGKKAKLTNATETELEILYDADIYEDKELPLPDEKDKELLLPDVKDKEPIELFDEDDSNEIKPLDGVWKSVFDSTNMTGCSAMMQSMLKKFTPPSTEKKLKFSQPFNPNKDFMAGQFKWTKIKANNWKGTMYQSGAMPQGMAMNGTMVLGVLSKKKMSIKLDQVIKFPKEIAQMMGSSTTCTVVTKGHYIKIK